MLKHRRHPQEMTLAANLKIVAIFLSSSLFFLSVSWDWRLPSPLTNPTDGLKWLQL